jgi:hypothetical protein
MEDKTYGLRGTCSRRRADAEVLAHVGVAGEQWRGEGQEGCAGGEKDSGEPGHDF